MKKILWSNVFSEVKICGSRIYWNDSDKPTHIKKKVINKYSMQVKKYRWYHATWDWIKQNWYNEI